MNAQYGLEFGKVKSARSTAYGVLTDDQGNMFSIEIKGTNEKDVRRFINYEKRQVKAGRGIRVSIESFNGPIPATVMGERPTRVHRQATWQGICIKFKELHVKAERPYKIHFTIDPPLEKNESRDFPLDNQPSADVKCRVTKGTVTMELFEFIDVVSATSVLVASGTFTTGEPQGFTGVQSQHTRNWNVRVTGQDSSNFTLELDLFVP